MTEIGKWPRVSIGRSASLIYGQVKNFVSYGD